MYLFNNLNTYNEAAGFAAVVKTTTARFPSSTDYFSERINRSADSIRENIAQGHSRWKEDERKNYFWQARESIQECAGLIEIAGRQGFINTDLKIDFRIKLTMLKNLVRELIHGYHEPQDRAESLALTIV